MKTEWAITPCWIISVFICIEGTLLPALSSIFLYLVWLAGWLKQQIAKASATLEGLHLVADIHISSRVMTSFGGTNRQFRET